MTCTNCGIWRPKSGLNILTATKVSPEHMIGNTVTVVAYCTEEPLCRIESLHQLVVWERLGKYTVHQTQPLSLEDEVKFLRTLLG